MSGSSSRAIADAVAARNAKKAAARAAEKAKSAQALPPPPAPAPVEAPTAGAAVAPRNTRQRSTVDFPAAAHRELVAWQQATAARLAMSRVTRQDLVTAAMRVMLDHPEVAELVVAEIQRANRP